MSIELKPPQRVAFIGLGVMGAPMARHLVAAGYAVSVFNRTRATAERWLEQVAATAPDQVPRIAESPADAARDAAAVLLCVGADADVEAVVEGADGVLESLGGSTLLIDHTTASPALAERLSGIAAARQIGFLDAPVSGGQSGAEHAALTIMVGGAERDFERARPLLDCYGKRVRRMGPAGAGQLTKIVNQVCIAGLLQGLSEGLHFAEEAGLDVGAVVDVISAGAAQSWQMDNRAKTMARREFDFGFAVDWMRKDLRLALAEAERRGARLPVAALVHQFYGDVQAMGGNRWDTSSLIQRLSTGTKSR